MVRDILFQSVAKDAHVIGHQSKMEEHFSLYTTHSAIISYQCSL